MKRILLLFPLSILALSMTFSSCEKSVETTKILVLDSIRHYSPILQGKDLSMSWRIANVGDNPLVITDIMPSCGCVCAEEKDGLVLPPGKEGTLHFTFSSEKYTGYVQHQIYLYGNIYPKGEALLEFDTNVVPSYNSSPDYEEFYKDNYDFESDDANYNRTAYEVDNPNEKTFTQQYFIDLDNRK